MYGNDAIAKSTVNQWVIQFRNREFGKAEIDDEKRSGRPTTATDDEHRKLVDDLTQMIQKVILNQAGISKERVDFITGQLR